MDKKKIWGEFWLDLACRYRIELIEFSCKHNIGLVPGYGYFTVSPGLDKPAMRAALMSIQDSSYHDWELAQELGHFWPTQWVLDNVTTKFYRTDRVALYSLCEAYHWLMGWLILKKLKLPTRGYWRVARAVLRAYHQSEEAHETKQAAFVENVVGELVRYTNRYGEDVVTMIL